MNKQASASGFIIMIVFLFVGLLAFVMFMPTALPFIDMIGASDASPLTKFLFYAMPLLTIVGLIVGVIFK